MLYPLTFTPLLKERIWGGRKLERLFQKALPNATSDRGVVGGQRPSRGCQCHRSRGIERQRSALGDAAPRRGVAGVEASTGGTFPLLVKILDAREKLSLQVHPPAARAAALGGEPKTEMWYIAEAEPGAQLFVGLNPGVTRQEFQEKIGNGTVAECFHRVNCGRRGCHVSAQRAGACHRGGVGHF